MKTIVSALLGGLLTASAAGQSGTLIVLNKSDHTASLVNIADGSVIATLPTGTGPHEVAVSPDGQWALVANYGDREPHNSLTLLDLKRQAVERTIDLGDYRRPHGIVWLEDGTRVAVTAESRKALLLVDPVAGTIQRALPTDQDVSHMVAVTPDSRRAFVTSIRSGNVTVFDLVTGRRLAIIATGAGAEGVDIAPDGSEVWITNRGDNTLSVVDTRTLTVVDTLACGEFPIRLKFTPDGTSALVSNAKTGDVAVFDVKQRKELRRLPMELSAVNDVDTRLFGTQFGTSPVPVGILIPPDGRRAYVANTNADLITVIDLREWKIIDRLRAGREPDGLAYSPLVLKP